MVGCGALGTVQATLLVRAGVGEIVLIDRDYVETSNLQRQWLFEEADVERAMPKAAAAAERLRKANSSCRIHAEVKDMTPQNAAALLTPADAILDGADNFAARYLLNDVAVKTKTPWIYGACRRHARFADAGRAGGNGLPVMHLPASSALAATDVRNVRGAQRRNYGGRFDAGLRSVENPLRTA